MCHVDAQTVSALVSAYCVSCKGLAGFVTVHPPHQDHVVRGAGGEDRAVLPVQVQYWGWEVGQGGEGGRERGGRKGVERGSKHGLNYGGDILHLNAGGDFQQQ